MTEYERRPRNKAQTTSAELWKGTFISKYFISFWSAQLTETIWLSINHFLFSFCCTFHLSRFFLFQSHARIFFIKSNHSRAYFLDTLKIVFIIIPDLVTIPEALTIFIIEGANKRIWYIDISSPYLSITILQIHLYIVLSFQKKKCC